MNKTIVKSISGLLLGTGTLLGGGTVMDARINPYTDVGTQKEIIAESVIPEAKETRIIADTTKPKVTMEKFGGEVALGINYPDIVSSGSRPLFSKNIEWDGGDQTMEMVPLEATTTMEDGGMEINIHLPTKPISNVFTFPLDGWENLDFFYQPELTTQEIAEGASRPENVVGSYAVYYKDHANHIIGQTNYATGKAYHIFRPLVTDADGATTWADMHYDTGVLTVTVPQDFLDKATYPVVVDPTFGYTTIGGSSLQVKNINTQKGSLHSNYTASTGDTETSESIYAKCHTAAGSAQGINLGTYTIVSSLPNSLQASTKAAAGINSTTAGWFTTSTFSFSLTGTTIYNVAIGMVTSGGCDSNGEDIFQDTAIPNDYSADATGGDLKTTWTNGGTFQSTWSVYATYTAGGGGAVAVPNTTIYNATLSNVQLNRP